MSRKFLDRKKLYACDPKNLYKLYEQEWRRIENLTVNRRKISRGLENNAMNQPLAKQLQPLLQSSSSFKSNSTTSKAVDKET